MNKSFQLSSEDFLLVSLAQTYIDPATEEKIKSLFKVDLDWNHFLNMASRHNLSSLVYWNLNKLFVDNVPERVIVNLKEHYNLNAKQNLLKLGKLMTILDVLNFNEVVAIPYKGPILAISSYGNLTLREFSDLDIFIPKKFFYQAEDIILKLGYKPVLNLKKIQKNHFLNFQREYKFINNNIPIEIKWRFPVSSFSFPEDPIILCDYEKLFFNNHVFNTLKPENLLLVLCLHNAGHYWSTLRGISDIVELINSADINWTICFSIAKKLRIQKIVFINLILANDLFDLKVPNDIWSYFDFNICCYSICEMIKTRFFSGESKKLTIFQKIKIRIQIREKYVDKLRDLFKMILVPTPNVIESVALPTLLSPIYYILRILQLLKIYLIIF